MHPLRRQLPSPPHTRHTSLSFPRLQSTHRLSTPHIRRAQCLALQRGYKTTLSPAKLPRPSHHSPVQCRRDMHQIALGNSASPAPAASHDMTSGSVLEAGSAETDGMTTDKIALPTEDVPLEELSGLLWRRLQEFMDGEVEGELLRQVQGQVRISLRVAEEALEKYSLDQISISYNGGKDCLVLLIIYVAALHSHYRRPLSQTPTSAANHTSPFPTSLSSIYIQPPHPFREVDDFVESSSRQYHLSLASSTLPMKAAFAEYLTQNTNVKAIFVGTRRTDPHGARLTHFDQTDGGWPDFMRIHPVIDWHYQEIWAFIKHFGIPYCTLYDAGYTSLGGTQDTLPNPKLATTEGTFRPASELVEDGEERLGRDVLLSLDPATKGHNV